MKKVVVFGGSGFLGSHVVEQLLAAGFAVRVYDRRRAVFLPAEVEFIEGDILDQVAVTSAVRGCDLVYHFAGIADIDDASSQPLETVTCNILGTVYILEACRALRVERFVYASTVYVFSETGSFYRCSKQACEQYILEYQRKFGLDFTILRYGTLYGNRAGEANSVYRYLKQALFDHKIVYYGTPDYIREYIHVEDAAHLSVEILQPEFRNEYIVLTGAHPTPVNQLFEMISEMLGGDLQIEYRPAPPHHYKITSYCFSPKIGKKLVSNTYFDMGQGLLRVLEEIHAVSIETEGVQATALQAPRQTGARPIVAATTVPTRPSMEQVSS